jgi:hypothetical protein
VGDDQETTFDQLPPAVKSEEAEGKAQNPDNS